MSLLYLPFDETGGTTAFDYSGSEIDGSIVGSVTVNQNPVISAGRSYLFSGGYVNIGAPVAIRNISELSLVAWINTSNNTNGDIIIQRDAGGIRYRFKLQAGNLRFLILASGGNGEVISTDTVPTNQPVMVAATYSHTTGTARLFINGVETGYSTNTSGSGTINSGTAVPIGIGNAVAGSGASFAGYIDEVSIWDAPLSEGSLQRMYELGLLSMIGSPGPLSWAVNSGVSFPINYGIG